MGAVRQFAQAAHGHAYQLCGAGRSRTDRKGGSFRRERRRDRIECGQCTDSDPKQPVPGGDVRLQRRGLARFGRHHLLHERLQRPPAGQILHPFDLHGRNSERLYRAAFGNQHSLRIASLLEYGGRLYDAAHVDECRRSGLSEGRSLPARLVRRDGRCRTLVRGRGAPLVRTVGALGRLRRLHRRRGVDARVL